MEGLKYVADTTLRRRLRSERRCLAAIRQGRRTCMYVKACIHGVLKQANENKDL